MRADGTWAHVDDDARELDGEVQLCVKEGAVRVLVPAHSVAPRESAPASLPAASGG